MQYVLLVLTLNILSSRPWRPVQINRRHPAVGPGGVSRDVRRTHLSSGWHGGHSKPFHSATGWLVQCSLVHLIAPQCTLFVLIVDLVLCVFVWQTCWVVIDHASAQDSARYYFVPSCEGLRPDVSVGFWRVMQFEYFSSVLCFYDSMNQFKHCPFVTSFSVSPFFDGDIFEVSMLFWTDIPLQLNRYFINCTVPWILCVCS